MTYRGGRPSFVLRATIVGVAMPDDATKTVHGSPGDERTHNARTRAGMTICLGRKS